MTDHTKPRLSDETLQEIEELVEAAVDDEGDHFWTGIGLLLQWYRAEREADTDHEDGMRACEALAEFHEKGGKPLGELKGELICDTLNLSENQIKQMAERFLGWRLPEDFSPDAGISFEREYNLNTPHPMKHEPTGTNLFDYEQALEMVRYMVDGTPPDTSHSPDFGDYVHIEQKRFGVPNEIYVYKVVGRLRSNTWCDVPVRWPETEDTHDHVTDVVRCICCGAKEDKVTKFRIADVRIADDGRFPARCGTCGEIIQPDTMTGTKCACSHPTEYRGELCDNCGRPYRVVYRVPNDVWARIASYPERLGPYPEHQGGGLLCPDCATVKAGEIGITLQFHAVEWAG